MLNTSKHAYKLTIPLYGQQVFEYVDWNIFVTGLTMPLINPTLQVTNLSDGD